MARNAKTKALAENLKTALAETTVKNPSLMTHVVLGYPSLEESLELVEIMAKSGAAFIELQIPFSDPIADGPTIMEANQHALDAGVTPAKCMKAIKKISAKVDVPLFIMSYVNILLSYKGGMKQFCKDAATAGVHGLIIPDIPPEDTREGYWKEARAAGLFPVPLVTPISGKERIEKIKKAAQGGFVYCVSTTGTTGARKALPADTAKYLKRIRKEFKLPLALGFGISQAEHIKALASHAEIAIVGSAVIDVIRKSKKQSRQKNVATFIKKLLK